MVLSKPFFNFRFIICREIVIGDGTAEHIKSYGFFVIRCTQIIVSVVSNCNQQRILLTNYHLLDHRFQINISGIQRNLFGNLLALFPWPVR